MTNFESEMDDKAFGVRGDRLRPYFGQWDSGDPVSHLILDIVEAQSEIANAIDDYNERDAGPEVIEAAVEQRTAAVKKLMDAISDQGCWPPCLRLTL